MSEPPIRFFVSSEIKRHFQTKGGLAEAMVLFPTKAGEIAHIAQTHLLLAALGLKSELVDSIPSEGIIVCHRRSFPADYKASGDILLVYCKGDWDVHDGAHLHVIQNPNDMRNLDAVLWPTHYIPHYPQPDLRPRSAERGDAFLNIAYVGDLDNLASELKGKRFREDLRGLGLNWRIHEHSKWSDYTEVDAVVAIRSLTDQLLYIEKPATKLFNAWHAQVPAILGVESGYRTHRTSDRDYIEVATYEELLSALKRLRNDAGLRRKIRTHAKMRASEVTFDGIARRWMDFLVSVAVPAYERWRRMSSQERTRFYQRRFRDVPRFKKASGSAGASRWIETHPESRVHNSQSEGIGRIEAFGGAVLINNLGRNIEVSRLENGALHRQWFFDETLYPNDDEPSQFDLDMHAFLSSPDGEHLLALNHHGLVRVFEMSSRRLIGSFLWYGDVERTVMIDDCLVGSSPNGYATGDPATDGIVIGEPWRPHVAPGSRNRIRSAFALEDWGKVSAIEAVEKGDKLAVVSERRLGLFSLTRNGGLKIKKLLWETELPFPANWIKDSPARRELCVAGEASFASFTEESGALIKQFSLAPDLAWGNGAVPLALAGDRLIGADRFGGIYAWSLNDISPTARAIRAITGSGRGGLGFAHMAVCGNHVLCGYNRGGYRILHADL